MLRWLMIGMLATTALAAAACSSGGGSTSGSPGDQDSTRTASAGGIDVQASWRTQEAVSQDFDVTDYPADRFLYLEVDLDTHSGDLKSIELPASVNCARVRAVQTAACCPGNDEAHHQGLLSGQDFEQVALSVLDLRISFTKWDIIPGISGPSWEFRRPLPAPPPQLGAVDSTSVRSARRSRCGNRHRLRGRPFGKGAIARYE
jgi:hypothetical protein